MVLEMEETVPAWLAKRAHIAKHVERPNKNASKVLTLTNSSTFEFVSLQLSGHSIKLLIVINSYFNAANLSRQAHETNYFV